MMKLPVFHYPEVWSFVPNFFMESAENLLIVLFCHCLSFQCILGCTIPQISKNTVSITLILLCSCHAWCVAIFQSVEPLVNLCYHHSIISKLLLNVTNCFALRITKLLTKFDAVSLLSHREEITNLMNAYNSTSFGAQKTATGTLLREETI